MAERNSLRGVVITEDKRTERFVRHLLELLGFDKRKFEFIPAPRGEGAGDVWVLSQYAPEIKSLRARAHQRLAVIAVIDGDGFGVIERKDHLARRLVDAGLAPLGGAERVATPVPTWAIENWLLNLLVQPTTEARCEKVVNDEGEKIDGRTWKAIFEGLSRNDEKRYLQNAAANWIGCANPLPSLVSGRLEILRLDR